MSTGKRIVVVAAVGMAILAVAFLFIGALPKDQTPLTAGATQRISANDELRMDFPEDMHRERTEQAITLPDGVSGTFRWDDATLFFKPDRALARGESYEVFVSKTAETSDGKPLPRDLVFKYIVTGAPILSAHTPARDAPDVPPNTNITLVFDRPMVALSQVQGSNARSFNDWPVTISPKAKGTWRWLSTYAAQFVIEGGLMPATQYTVTVPAGIETATGEGTEQAVTWSFVTERPRVISSDPAEDDPMAGPATEITLHFNQEMNLKSISDHLQIVKTSGSGSARETSVPIKDVKYGKKEVNKKEVTDRQAVMIVPQSPYQGSSSYVLKLLTGALATEGNLGTAEEFRLEFSTAGPLAVTSARQNFGGIEIEFTSPLIDVEMKHFSISPKVTDWEHSSISVNFWDQSRLVTIFPPTLEPSTTYTVTVSKDFEDSFGQKLGKPYTFTFETEPLRPEVSLAESKGEFGIFERSKPPVYYLNAVNVSKIDVEFAKLSLDEFIAMRRDRTRLPTPVGLEDKEGYEAWTMNPTKKKLNQWEVLPLDLEKKFGKLAPGIYTLRIRAPEMGGDGSGYPPIVEQFFAITNTSLTLKYSGNKILVWATDMTTGEAVSNALVDIRALNGSVPLSGRTDAQGFFEGNINIDDVTNQSYEWRPEFWVTARKGDDFAFVSSTWNGGFDAYDFSLWSDFQSAEAKPLRMFTEMITDRPLYRPGDTVSFKGIVRLKDWNGKLQLPGFSRKAEVVIEDPNGSEVYRKTLPFTPYGGFYGALPLAENPALGLYTFQIKLLPEGESDANMYAGSFGVLAYRKPEYKVELTPQRDDYMNGESVEVNLDGAYYFGAPLSNAPVDWRVTLSDYFFNQYTGDGWYSFSTQDAWCWRDCSPTMGTLTEGTGRLDAAGKMTIRVPVNIDEKPLSQVATIEADVTDPNNQLVSNRTSVFIHKSNVYVGIRNEDYAVTPGQAAKIGIITLNPQGKPVANQSVTLSVYSRTWNSIRKKGVDGEYYFENEYDDEFIRAQRVTTGPDGKITASVVLPSGGEYQIVAEAKDSASRSAKAATSVYAWSSTYINWPHANNSRIDVVADKPEYKVGDTAKLLVKSPFQGEGVKALVTVERENVITKKLIDVTSNALPIEVPITEDLIPNAFVSVVIVKPRQGETFDDQGRDTGVPAFRIGYAQLFVEKEKKLLNVEITTNKEQYLPGEKVTSTITVKNSDGKPVEGEFTFAAVDMSVLALSSFGPPDAMVDFYSQRGLGVVTSQMLTYLVERFKPGSKGGGGGDGADRARGNFQDTAYWNPIVVTNKEGKATVAFTLPDNLTTWQLLAIGSTEDSRFGIGRKEILETKQVIIRPIRPRFAVRKDEINLGAIVHNYLGNDRTFTVSLSGSGFTAKGKTSQSVTVKAGQLMTVQFPVTVNDVSGMTMNFRAVTENARDEITEKIPVYIYGAPQSVATAGETQNLITERVLVPSTEDASSGKLTVTVSPTLAAALPGGLEYVLNFPYGCAEQVTSSFLPQIALKKLQGFDAFRIVSNQQLETNIRAGLQSIYKFQRSDGGFGYWEDSPRSSAPLTAYILFGLRQAHGAGYAVDAGVMDRAGSYLSAVLRGERESLHPIDLPTRAYILYVLAEIGKADSNLLNNVYEKRLDLPVFAQAQLAMAMKKSGNASKAKTLLSDVLDGAKIDPRGAHVEERGEQRYRHLMQDNTRTTAEVLMATIRIDPGNSLIPQFVRYLLAVRKDGHWDTTQSTVQTILALVEYLKSTGELDADYVAGVDINGTMMTHSFNDKNILTKKDVVLMLDDLMRGEENILKIGKDGEGTLFYDVLLSYFSTADEIEPIDQGMSIMRELGTVSEGGAAGLREVKAGETYRVTLTMTVPEDRHYVAVESPLPAGLEAIDTQLQTSAQTGEGVEEIQRQQSSYFWWWDSETDNGVWRFNHKEFRDDRVFLFADYLPAGVYKYTYLVRATTPGRYRERPATMYEMYFPENFGQTEGNWFTVKQ